MRPLLVGTAATVSLLVHAGIVVAALAWVERVAPGTISEPSDAVSVELVATDTTDALKPERATEPAPAPEATAPVAGTTAPAEPSEKEEKPETREPIEKGDVAPAPDAHEAETRAADLGKPPDVPAVPTIPAAPTPEPPAEAVPDPPKAAAQGEDAQSKPKETKQAEKKVAQPQGGTTSKAKAGKGTGSARISASAGSIVAYADRVQSHVHANRPSGGTPGSTTIVAFGLTSSGALAYARISRSSGDAANDRMALGALRSSAPFPTPPAGATPAQLQFTFPYHFR